MHVAKLYLSRLPKWQIITVFFAGATIRGCNLSI